MEELNYIYEGLRPDPIPDWTEFYSQLSPPEDPRWRASDREIPHFNPLQENGHNFHVLRQTRGLTDLPLLLRFFKQTKEGESNEYLLRCQDPVCQRLIPSPIEEEPVFLFSAMRTEATHRLEEHEARWRGYCESEPGPASRASLGYLLHSHPYLMSYIWGAGNFPLPFPDSLMDRLVGRPYSLMRLNLIAHVIGVPLNEKGPERPMSPSLEQVLPTLPMEVESSPKKEEGNKVQEEPSWDFSDEETRDAHKASSVGEKVWDLEEVTPSLSPEVLPSQSGPSGISARPSVIELNPQTVFPPLTDGPHIHFIESPKVPKVPKVPAYTELASHPKRLSGPDSRWPDLQRRDPAIKGKTTTGQVHKGNSLRWDLLWPRFQAVEVQTVEDKEAGWPWQDHPDSLKEDDDTDAVERALRSSIEGASQEEMEVVLLEETGLQPDTEVIAIEEDEVTIESEVIRVDPEEEADLQRALQESLLEAPSMDVAPEVSLQESAMSEALQEIAATEESQYLEIIEQHESMSRGSAWMGAARVGAAPDSGTPNSSPGYICQCGIVPQRSGVMTSDKLVNDIARLNTRSSSLTLWKCSSCRTSFCRTATLREHYKTGHKRVCRECKCSFKSRSFQKHLIASALNKTPCDSSPRLTRCYPCDISLPQSEYRMHLSLHKNPKLARRILHHFLRLFLVCQKIRRQVASWAVDNLHTRDVYSE